MIRAPWVSAMVHYWSDGDECRAACVTAFATDDEIANAAEADDGREAPGGHVAGLTLHLKIMYPFGDMVALAVPYNPFEQGAHDTGAWHWPDHQQTPAAPPRPPSVLSARPPSTLRPRDALDSAMPHSSVLRRAQPAPAIVVVHEAGTPDLRVQRCGLCGHELLDRRLSPGATPPGEVDVPPWFGVGAQVAEYASGLLCDRSTIRETSGPGVTYRACHRVM